MVMMLQTLERSIHKVSKGTECEERRVDENSRSSSETLYGSAGDKPWHRVRKCIKKEAGSPVILVSAAIFCTVR